MFLIPYSFMVHMCAGDYGTFVVHGGEETDKTGLQTALYDARGILQDHPGNIEGLSVSGTGGKSADPWYSIHHLTLMFIWENDPGLLVIRLFSV